MIHMISYDLKGPANSYERLYETIKSYGTWWHYLESTWIVRTCENPQEVYQKLQPALRPEDSLIIFNVTDSGYYGILPPKAWEWIKTNRQEK